MQLKKNFGEIKRFKENRNYNSDTSGKSLVTGAILVANDASKKNICAFCLGKHMPSSCTKFEKPKKGERYFRSTVNVLAACRRGIGLRNA